MKLAEALILRADLKKKTEQLRGRLTRNVKVQEGDAPVERPEALLAEFDGIAAELEALIRRINWTNATAPFEGDLRIGDAVAMRDTLDLRIRIMREVIDEACERERFLTHSEIRFIPTVNAAVMQKELDELSRKRRDLDMRIQQTNWQVDLLVISL
jgi:hypothetical protein